MNETSRLIRPAMLGIAVLLLMSACSSADWPSRWATDTAEATCPARQRQSTANAVLEVDGETVLVAGIDGNANEDDKLGVVRFSGGDPVAGLEPATNLTPDKVICLTLATGSVVTCPDGTVLTGSSTKIEATLHSLAMDSELGSTEVLATKRCRDASDSSGPRTDAYDFDQVLCELLTCVISDDIADRLTAMRAGDPRAEVCGFAGQFIDGVIELEDGPVYVAHELGYPGALADAASAFDTATDRTLCIAAAASVEQVSCGDYQLEGEYYGGVRVNQRGVDVNAQWFDGDSTVPSASTSSTYYSDCTDQISIVTTTYGGSSIGIRDTNERVEHGSLTAEHVAWIAEDLREWSEVNAAAPSVTAGDCAAIAQIPVLENVQRQLDGYEFEAENRALTNAPPGLADDVGRMQSITSEMFDQIDAESAVFGPVFELWYVAHFNWPLINTFADPSDPDATDEDFELTLMGMPARVGLVSAGDPTFVTRHETVSHLAEIYLNHC